MANQKRSGAIALRDFERACDELFDELLGRWRGEFAAAGEPAMVVDCGNHYEVRIAVEVPDPRTLAVEISGSKLVVRVPAGALPPVEHRLTFAHPVDSEHIRARWAHGVLTIRVPKAQARRIKIE
ncbi:MAG TPA: Hsp20/alpha crystallin family protein [Candidatus Binataceae bacterium]|nr:Hsp20/alpha crystallin family protein [Candidatus Binataceae bacterium]